MRMKQTMAIDGCFHFIRDTPLFICCTLKESNGSALPLQRALSIKSRGKRPPLAKSNPKKTMFLINWPVSPVQYLLKM